MVKKFQHIAYHKNLTKLVGFMRWTWWQSYPINYLFNTLDWAYVDSNFQFRDKIPILHDGCITNVYKSLLNNRLSDG
jgi:hypothetical protein